MKNKVKPIKKMSLASWTPKKFSQLAGRALYFTS